jgi:HYDIN/CFA65/VesB family protein
MTLRFLPALLLATAPLCHAELPGLFAYVSPDVAPAVVVPNGTITIPSVLVNQTSSVTLIATNSGANAWLLGDATVSGLPFKVNPVSGQVPPGGAALITLSFSPTKGGAASATFSLTVSSVPQPGGLKETATFVFVLKGTGLAPNFVPSYFLNPAGNQVPLADQSTMTFNPTLVGQTSSVTVIIANTGNGPGTFNSVSISGDGFQLAGLPLVPAQVAPTIDVRFTIVFTPKASTPYTGSLRVVLDGVARTVALSGTGLSPQLVYETQSGSTTQTLAPNGTLTLPSTPPGGSSTVTVRIRNTGTGDGQVGTIKIASTGTIFALANVPPLPAVLPAGQSLTFSVVFKPTDVGEADTQLFIDNVAINLAGTGVGPRLTLAVDPGNGPVPVDPNGAILFPNTSVGSTSSVLLQVTNSGNARTTVNSITISGAVFTLSGMPGLPATLEPGQALSLSAVFTPNGIPAATGSLQIDNLTYTLRGAGTAPPALPPVSFQTVPGNVGSQQQPAFGMKIAQPYPLDISGTLKLVFTSSVFGDDSAIQFATGGRTADFKIPANSTDAVFGQSGTTISFQTGTVAGAISVTAVLSTGTVDVTPVPAPGFTTQVSGAAPVVRSVQVGNRTTNGFELLITGYSNMRSVSRLTLAFTGSPGASLTTTSLDINSDSAFSTWYQGATSWTFGSQFTASVLITANGKPEDVQSVSVTAANALGASSPATVNLR